MDKIEIEINFNNDCWDFDIWVAGEEIATGTRDSLEECNQAIKEHLKKNFRNKK